MWSIDPVQTVAEIQSNKHLKMIKVILYGYNASIIWHIYAVESACGSGHTGQAW
jgi:hypothetical protein